MISKLGGLFGVADIKTIEYFKKPERFADIFNLVLYHGRQVIDPGSLRPLDTQYNSTIWSADEDSPGGIKRYRDIINAVVTMESPYAILLITALELFDYVDYIYPLRAMTYDALEYERQARALIAENRTDKNHPLRSGSEYLTGLKKGDRIKPVVTIALYLSPDPWDGPRSLHEMLDFVDPDLKAFVPDYRPIIIAVDGLPEREISKLKTEVRKLIKFTKYSKNKQLLSDKLHADPDLQTIDTETIDTINLVNNLHIKHPEGTKEVNMFPALQEWYDEAVGDRDNTIARQEATIAEMDASLAQKDASLAEQASLIDKLTAQLIAAGITPAK